MRLKYSLLDTHRSLLFPCKSLLFPQNPRVSPRNICLFRDVRSLLLTQTSINERSVYRFKTYKIKRVIAHDWASRPPFLWLNHCTSVLVLSQLVTSTIINVIKVCIFYREWVIIYVQFFSNSFRVSKYLKKSLITFLISYKFFYITFGCNF